MENYENFKSMNAAWNGGDWSESEMERNYQVASEIVDAYKKRFPDETEPKIGDIVEFSDGTSVYKHAKITEDLYGRMKYGLMCICEQGSSHVTKNAGFSTSGGSFVRRHKSLMVLSGKEQNLVWAWGCHGAGASQGVYFSLDVNKWLIPYDKNFLTRSVVKINGGGRKNWKGEKMPAVNVSNLHEWYGFQDFESIKAFRKWADFIGYKTMQRNSCLDLVSNQRLVRGLCVCKDEDIPKDAKVIKMILNGRARDCWVLHEGNDIVFRVDNRPLPLTKYGTKEYEEELAEFRKYKENPLGI